MALLNYTQQKKVGRVVFHIVVVFLCFLMTYPLLYMLSPPSKLHRRSSSTPTPCSPGMVL